MPAVHKTSYLGTDGKLHEVRQAKFALGELVGCPEGYTGTVVLSMPYEKKYLVDCYPGALGGYSWVWIDRGAGGPDLEALNWLEEHQLRKLRKRGKR